MVNIALMIAITFFLDCSACLGGGGYRCVHECYKQIDICEARECAQVDYDSFCTAHGAGICW